MCKSIKLQVSCPTNICLFLIAIFLTGHVFNSPEVVNERLEPGIWYVDIFLRVLQIRSIMLEK